MITATGLELRAGTRILLADTSLRLHHGDRVGLVGRNGAGKTTTLRVLAGEGTPHGGTVTRTLPIGYLPQDPREGDMDVTAKDRVLSARGLDVLVAQLEKVQIQMSELTDARELDVGHRAVRPDRGAVLRRSAGTPPNPRRPGSARTWACRTGCWRRP